MGVSVCNCWAKSANVRFTRTRRTATGREAPVIRHKHEAPFPQQRSHSLFNLAIDNKLRGCDLVGLRVRDVVQGIRIVSRAIVMQKKTQRPMQFEITEQTRDAVASWIAAASMRTRTRNQACFRQKRTFRRSLRAADRDSRCSVALAGRPRRRARSVQEEWNDADGNPAQAHDVGHHIERRDAVDRDKRQERGARDRP